ncbi:uncharacterized protein LOC125633754 [Caretta caretta]|uniref:uncharacterized protein LOC125633754 n=1 Tax=Caretta caretta TaxID=8467 RepID=UPI003F4B9735
MEVRHHLWQEGCTGPQLNLVLVKHLIRGRRSEGFNLGDSPHLSNGYEECNLPRQVGEGRRSHRSKRWNREPGEDQVTVPLGNRAPDGRKESFKAFQDPCENTDLPWMQGWKADMVARCTLIEEKRGKLQVTMQSSSAQVTMMESQNRKRAPAWTEREVRDLIAVWGEESVLSELRSSFRNAKTFVKISQGMKDRGHNRDPKQCRVKLKELRQAYQKTREANSRSASEPQTCRFYDELHAILGGSATTTPAVLFDSFNGDGGNMEAGFGDEEDDDEEEVVDSSQQASGETGFPDSQELFLTLDLEPVPPEPTQGCLLDPAGGEGTSAACVSMITGSSPSQRLVKLRKKKKRTRDEMFSELMLSSHTDRAQTNAWRQIMSECRKAQNDREERWRAEESKWQAEESKWWAEDRAEAQMWRQRDERRQDSMLRLLQDQTSMLQCMVELQQRQLEHRLPLLPLYCYWKQKAILIFRSKEHRKNPRRIWKAEPHLNLLNEEMIN